MTDKDQGSPAAVQERINTLLRQGKTVYQPLYNYPYEQIIDPLRACEDRCKVVWASMGPDAKGAGLWDVGCSLGYNSLYFVERGLTVRGTDIDPRNIAICQEISQYTPGDVEFAQEDLSLDRVRHLPSDRFDYAFFFSILHHIIEARGLSYVQEMMREVLLRIPVLYVELALRAETSPTGYSWEHHLPEKDLSIFNTAGDPVIEVIGHFPTHVCPVSRPLYRVSRRLPG